MGTVNWSCFRWKEKRDKEEEEKPVNYKVVGRRHLADLGLEKDL